MTDLFKDLVKAWEERVRSPFLGSIGIAFVACNWKPIFFLLFSGEPVLERFAFFDSNTSSVTLFWNPLWIGFLLTLAIPWLKFMGALIAKAPTTLLNSLQGDLASERRIHAFEKAADEEEAKARLEAAQEQRRIDAAKRLEEATKIGNQDLVEEIKLERETKTKLKQEKDAIEQIEDRLTGELKALILEIGKVENGGVSKGELSLTPSLLEKMEQVLPNVTSTRIGVEIESGTSELSLLGIAESDRQGRWRLTKLGYKLFDRLRSQF